MKSIAEMGVAETESLFRRYGRFCVVGGSGVLVDMAVLGLLATGLGWNLSVAKVQAAEVAIVNNYAWNDLWTFRGRSGGGWRGWLAGLGRFNLICLAGIGWSVLLLNGGVYGLGLNVYLANGIAIVLVSVWNFWLSERFGWKRAVSCLGRCSRCANSTEQASIGRHSQGSAGAVHDATEQRPRSIARTITDCGTNEQTPGPIRPADSKPPAIGKGRRRSLQKYIRWDSRFLAGNFALQK